jgi:hypothetical protein
MGPWTRLRLIQRASAWFVIASSLLMVISGLNWYSSNLWNRALFHPHVRYDLLTSIGIIIHSITGGIIALKRNKVPISLGNSFFVIIALFAIISVFYIDRNLGVKDEKQEGTDLNDIEKFANNTKPVKLGRIRVGSATFEFDPNEVKTVRPDIFKPGYFSMFDVLVHVANEGYVALEYHFDKSMNTHVIDKLEGETDWWYLAYYDGGWSETNYFRSDHYPWKDGSVLYFFKVQSSRLELTYSIFREEIARLNGNDGKIVIPRVVINGPTVNEEFDDVVVTSHNLRNDTFQDGLITAIDVILSLEDQGKLEYGLKWYESIGTARIVKNYWVESIGNDVASGRCGFVYESGDLGLQGFAGNHIHLPSDSRLLNSPEYVLFFWICI